MLEELLQKIGFSEREALVYVVLVKQGRLSPVQLSRLTKIKRTTIYSILKELIEKDLVAQDLTHKNQLVYALPVQQLITLVGKQEREVNKRKELTKRAVSELDAVTTGSKFSIPRTSFISEEQIESFLYEQTDKWNQSILQYDKTMWGFSSAKYVSEYFEYMVWFWEHAPKELELKLLGDDLEVEQKLSKKFPKRKIKVATPPFHFTASTIICGDYILLVTTKQRPYYLIEIYDVVLAQNLRELYKRMWQSIK